MIVRIAFNSWRSKFNKIKLYFATIAHNESKNLFVFRSLFLVFLFFYLSFLAFQTELFEPDEVAHYSLNRSVLFNPKFLVNPWGKPLFILMSFVIIQISSDAGLIAIRLFNISTSAITCLLTFKLCRKLGVFDYYASLSIPLLLTSPLFAKISFSALTEPLFTLILVSAFYFFYSGKHNLSSVLLSLSCLARQEGFIFIPLLFIFSKKNRRVAFLTLVFPLIWGFVLTLLGYSPLHMITMYPSILNPLVLQWEDTTMLGQGLYSFIYYVVRLPTVLGPFLLLLSIIGLFYNVITQGHLLLPMSVTAYLLFHSLILVFPYFGSVGFVRHIYPIIPLITILGVKGFQAMVSLAVERKYVKAKVRKHLKMLLINFFLLISLINLLSTTTAPYDRAVLLASSSSYNALQHEVGQFLVSHYPKNVDVFCPSSMFILQLYLTLPNLYWYKEHPLGENYTILKLDGEFPLYSFNIYRDCPKGALVIWSSDLIGSEFSPLRINRTLYAERFNVGDALHRIIVYERM